MTPKVAIYTCITNNYDTLTIDNVLIETYDTGLRLGAADTHANYTISNVIIDKVRDVGIHIETDAGGTAQNILISNCWVAGTSGVGTSIGVFINDTAGTIQNIQLSNIYLTDIRQRSVWLAGSVEQVEMLNILSVGGGAQTANTYPAFDLGGTSSGIILSNSIVTGQNNYGVEIDSGITNFTIVNNNLIDVDTAAISDAGTPSATRRYTNNLNSLVDTSYVQSLFLQDDDLSAGVTIQSPAAITSYTLTLPTDDGDSGEVLSTNGSGVLSWAAASAPGAHASTHSENQSDEVFAEDLGTTCTSGQVLEGDGPGGAFDHPESEYAFMIAGAAGGVGAVLSGD